MTNPCTCKAEHWQPHADTCPAKQFHPQCIHIPDGSVVISGEVFDHFCGFARQQKAYDEAIEQLRGNLSLAEDGLANYALEVEQLKDRLATQKGVIANHVEGEREIERLRTALRQLAHKAGEELGGFHSLVTFAEEALGNEPTAHEPSEPLTDCEASLRIYDPGQTSEYWLRHAQKSCEHDLQKKDHTMVLTHDLRTGHEYDSVAKCKVCDEQFIHPLHSSLRTE
jgi:regulator of replication initiation timing